MPDWLNAWLNATQGGVVQGLAAELRAGGIATAGLAFLLGALHALTPGHGKAALLAYFLGREAKIVKGLRVALLGALLHVVAGFAIFLIMRFIVGTMPATFGRPSASFTLVGYGLIMLAGAIMVYQSYRPQQHSDHPHALTAGIGLLPCPLTISVLGFAWSQSNGLMVLLTLAALTLGIAFTIGSFAVAAIAGRRSFAALLAPRLAQLQDWSRGLQAAAGSLIVGIGVWSILDLTLRAMR